MTKEQIYAETHLIYDKAFEPEIHIAAIPSGEQRKRR